jgi:hypothetical protein
MENSNIINIYFIDNSSESVERKAAFSQVLPSQIFHQVNNINDAHVICAHSVNLEGYNEEGETKYAEANSPKLIIIYSGGGTPSISTVDLDSKKVLRIEKAISALDNITSLGWYKIYSLIDTRQNIFLDNILLLGEDEFLCALSILCQGYLLNALSNPELNKQTIESSIKDAMDLMKLEDRTLINYHTLDANWWTDCFDSKQIQILKMINSPKVTNLLEKVDTEKKSPDLKIVAEAYLAIYKILPTI